VWSPLASTVGADEPVAALPAADSGINASAPMPMDTTIRLNVDT
jgi:hypothetical protein